MFFLPFFFSSTKSRFQVIRSLWSNAFTPSMIKKSCLFCSPRAKSSLSSYAIVYLNCSFTECSAIRVIQDVVISKELPITSCLSLGSSNIFLLVCVGFVYVYVYELCNKKKDRMHAFLIIVLLCGPAWIYTQSTGWNMSLKWYIIEILG